MKTNELRKIFLKYFEKNGHKILSGSSLIPMHDPTLLFVNAGMVPFKNIFLGLEKRPALCVTTVQPCLRVSGKHNDLEQVGFTARHHTFFEMLGNFSFGDYFKREAIQFAWEFLTGKKWLNIPAKKLWITVYKEDDEAADIWLKEIKVDKNRFSRCGEAHNFWSMGNTGPCGPCSEIFYDHGPKISGVSPGSSGEEGDRYVEIWNLVFMQFNRDENGKLTPLAKPCVDTGMGLERIAAVMQQVHNNYEIDLFKHLIQAVGRLTHITDLTNSSLRVIADHIRASAFLIVDGIVPSNEKRGYVLRRIIRRAVRHGHKLGVKKPFFYRLVKPLIEEMGEAYPNLKQQKKQIETVLLQEEEQFNRTVDQGLKIFEDYVATIKGKKIPGEIIFKLYDTYGFPVDLTEVIAAERNLKIDRKGFDREMAKQRQQSQNASRFGVNQAQHLTVSGKTLFKGYETCQCESKIIAIFKDDKPVKVLEKSEEGMVVLDGTPFYAESGGQVGDVGELKGKNSLFQVKDTQKNNQAFLHIGFLKSGKLKVGDIVTAAVNETSRQRTKLNHTTTHLLHVALRKILGDHVQQKGSYVESQRLRFDFSHKKPVSKSELNEIEMLVNKMIRENHLLNIKEMTLKEAQKQGAIALFGEKYGDKVRVVSIEKNSKELCGGTHVERTGDIGLFKIVSEEGIAAGVRRIEALTGESAFIWINEQVKMLHQMSQLFKTGEEQLLNQVQQLMKDKREMEKALGKIQGKMARDQGKDLVSQAEMVGDLKVLAATIDDVGPKELREVLDMLKDQLDRAVIVLASVQNERVFVVVGTTKNCPDGFHAGELIQSIMTQIEGKGGGRADMAQGRGKSIENLPKALKSVKNWVEQKIGKS